MTPTSRLILGDSTARMGDIENKSVDCVITDPPYPEIDRDYGRMTEAAWWDMMMVVCRETRRILKPTGSAVFILQPNSRKVGSMRGWLWEFMAWVCRDWNMVQDVWWWNVTTMPHSGATTQNMLRASLKACVWCGIDSCYRDQSKVLWEESDITKWQRLHWRSRHSENRPSGHSTNDDRMNDAIIRRGGVTPFNVLPFSNGGPHNGGMYGHSAATPLAVASWWTRYICPPGGTVCDPFMGSGTMGLAALAYGCQFIGIEKEDRPGYFPTAAARLAEAAEQPVLQSQPALLPAETDAYQQMTISA